MTGNELLEFAAKYWYVIIVLIGFAASMFSKRLEPPKGEGRPTSGGGNSAERRSGGGPSMPPFGGGGSPFGRPRGGAPAAQQRREPAVPVGDRKAASRRDADAAPAAWPAEPLQAPPAGAPANSAAAAAGSAGSAARSAAAQLRNGPDAHALAQGVLWAEILGPPRAKRPRIR